MDWHDVGSESSFEDGSPACVAVGSIPVAVFRDGDNFHALHDLCTHGAARLSDGFVENGCVECPLHQGLFDLKTGAPKGAPVTEPVRVFPIRVIGGRVEVGVETA